MKNYIQNTPHFRIKTDAVMQNNLPLVSIVIVSFNEIHKIGDCLSDLFAQTYLNYEVLVYDNASIDGTPEYIEQNFPQVKLIKGTENLGFGGANNRASAQAKGKYLAFVNDDAYVTPNWLEPLVNLLEMDNTVGCAGAELLCAEKEKRNIVLCHGNDVHLSGIAYLKNNGQIVKPADPIEAGAISGAAFVIKREIFLEIGGFESDFFLYYEDTDLSLRLRLIGKRCVIVPGSIVYHNSESRFSNQKIFFLERNRYLSLFTLMNTKMLTLMAPSMFLFELVSWGYCLIRGKEVVASKIKSWQEIYKKTSWILARRRAYIGPDKKTSTIFILKTFTPHINIGYVNSNKILGKISWIIGYLVAWPVFGLLTITDIFSTKNNRYHNSK
jgi:GT2 family glycosyltransferase